MTDLEKLKALLDSFGIKYDVDEDAAVVVSIETGQYPENEALVKGYHGFASNFKFTLDGKFIEVHLFE